MTQCRFTIRFLYYLHKKLPIKVVILLNVYLFSFSVGHRFASVLIVRVIIYVRYL